jgi:hypothetical protein
MENSPPMAASMANEAAVGHPTKTTRIVGTSINTMEEKNMMFALSAGLTMG